MPTWVLTTLLANKLCRRYLSLDSVLMERQRNAHDMELKGHTTEAMHTWQVAGGCVSSGFLGFKASVGPSPTRHMIRRWPPLL